MQKQPQTADTGNQSGVGAKQPNTYRKSVTTTTTEYYLTGIIGAAEDYTDLCNLLRSATSDDEIIIRINSGGGNVATGNMIINAIKESEAYVQGVIEASCGSMATMIFLACHGWVVSESAEFFIHTSSGGFFGKEPETFAYAEFVRRQTHKFLRHRYTGFLTNAEITKVIEGADMYFDAAEITQRLVNYIEQNPLGAGATKADISTTGFVTNRNP